MTLLCRIFRLKLLKINDILINDFGQGEETMLQSYTALIRQSEG